MNAYLEQFKENQKKEESEQVTILKTLDVKFNELINVKKI